MAINSIFATLIFVFGSIGFTQIVVEGKIFKPVKEFLSKFMPDFYMQALDCYQCTGFWAGVICGLLVIDYNIFIENWINIKYLFVCGCAGSCLSFFWAYLITFIESNTMLK